MRRIWLILVLLLALCGHASAYSVLTHLALVDTCWTRTLVPALQSRFPGACELELRQARAYAYGGAAIQDLGSYPFGAALFTDLTHYARSGDFVRNLLDGARTRDEYAFALGALAHYVADNGGHPHGTNQVLALVYPQQQKQGSSKVLTYADAPTQHTRVEYAFDASQVAAGRYRSEDFHAAIGLRVSEDLLAQAFQATYGLPLHQVLGQEAVSFAAYQLTVTELVPLAMRAQQLLSARRVRALSREVRRAYYAAVNAPRYRRGPGPRPESLSLDVRLAEPLLGLLPRLGLVRLLAYRPLPAQAEAIMRASYAQVQVAFRVLVAEEGAGRRPVLVNTNLDTGLVDHAGDYSLTDQTYAAWLRKLVQHPKAAVPLAVRDSVGAFYRRFAAGEPLQKTAPFLARLYPPVPPQHAARPTFPPLWARVRNEQWLASFSRFVSRPQPIARH